MTNPVSGSRASRMPKDADAGWLISLRYVSPADSSPRISEPIFGSGVMTGLGYRPVSKPFMALAEIGARSYNFKQNPPSTPTGPVTTSSEQDIHTSLSFFADIPTLVKSRKEVDARDFISFGLSVYGNVSKFSDHNSGWEGVWRMRLPVLAEHSHLGLIGSMGMGTLFDGSLVITVSIGGEFAGLTQFNSSEE